jgi:hypothetical protein
MAPPHRHRKGSKGWGQHGLPQLLQAPALLLLLLLGLAGLLVRSAGAQQQQQAAEVNARGAMR